MLKRMVKLAAVAAFSGFTVVASAADLDVFGNMVGNMANVHVWSNGQPVSEGQVMVKDSSGMVIAKGSVDSKGRAHLVLPFTSGVGNWKVTAVSGEMSGATTLINPGVIGRR